jgi:DNA end-binding protein Ku
LAAQRDENGWTKAGCTTDVEGVSKGQPRKQSHPGLSRRTGKLALYGREYLVAVRPTSLGLPCTRCITPEKSPHRYRRGTALGGPTVKPEEVKLAKQVIATFEGPLDLANYKDEYREGLKRIIEAKIAGEGIVAPAVEAPARVVNLMDALKKSLDAVSTERKKPAKATVTKPVAKRKRA